MSTPPNIPKQSQKPDSTAMHPSVAAGYVEMLDLFAQASDTAYDAPVFVISVAAQLAGMHPQTLRQYDRLGLVQPGRTPGGGRRYSAHNIVMLREVSRLSQDEGVNLAGVKRIMELENAVRALEEKLADATRALAEARSVAHVPRL